LTRSVPISIRSPRSSRPLLFPHLLERQSRTDRDYIEDGMRWVGRHAKRMNSFPGSNADVWRVEVGTLLGQLRASLFGTLMFFVSEAFSGSLYKIACAGQRHGSIQQ
jgi:hypothetical protein